MTDTSPSFTVARWVSILGHPFVFVMLLVAVSTLQAQGAWAALRAVIIVCVVTLIPVGLFMINRVRSGKWGTVDASSRSERPALYALAACLIGALCLLALRTSGMGHIAKGASSILVLLLISYLMNRWIKASLHMAFCAFTGVVGFRIDPAFGIAVLTYLPLLAWARLAMNRHTVREVVAGTGIGAVVGAILIFG